MSGEQAVRRAGRHFVAGVLLASLAAPVASAGEGEREAGGERRKGLWIPGAYLSIAARSPAEALSGVAEFAEGIRPGLGGEFRAGLGGRLGFADAGKMAAIGGERPAAVLLLNPRRYTGHFAFAVGDGGVGAFVGAIARALGEEVDGGELVELGELMLGADENMFYMRHVAPWIVGAPDPDALDAVAKAVKRGKVPTAPEAKAQLSVTVDMRELRSAFGDVVAGWLQLGRTGVAAMPADPRRGRGVDPQVLSLILGEYISAFEAIFKGFDRFDLSVRLTRESAEIAAAATPAEEGVFAPLAEAERPATFGPAVALPDDVMMAVASRLDEEAVEGIAGAFAEALLRIASGPAGAGGDAGQAAWTCAMHPQLSLPAAGKCPICGMGLIRAPGGKATTGLPAPADAEAKEKLLAEYRKIMREWLAGEFATAVGHSEGRMETVWAMDKDRETVRRMNDRMMGLLTGEFGGFLKAFGMGMSYQYQEDVRRAEGRQVDRMTVTYTLEGEMAKEMELMFQAMMGGLTQVTEVCSLAKGGTVVAWGEDPAKVLDEALAREREAADFEGRGWPGASRELKAVLQRAPENTWLAFEFRMCSYMEFAMGMMRKAQAEAAVVIPDPKGLGEGDVPIVGWCASEDGRIVFREHVPVASIKKMVKFFEQFEGPGRRGRGTVPPPPPGEPEIF